MDDTYNHVIPNMNAEEYRNLSDADRPPVHDKQLQVIKVFQDKSVIIGASNMTDRTWSGTFLYFNQLENFDKNNAYGAIRADSGIADAAFLGQHDKCIIGEDSGMIQIVKLIDEKNVEGGSMLKSFSPLSYSCEHDDCLITLSVFDNNVTVVSAGMDCCIKVWNVTEDLKSMYSYNSAHCDTITCVSAQAKSDSIFASTSMDSDALIWDIRKEKPAHGIFKKKNCGLTAIAWKPNDENIAAIGAEDGSITIVDIRNPNSEVSSNVLFDRAVYKLEFNPQIPNQLAGCCDGNMVKMFDIDRSLATIYEDDRHQDFVRGLAWYQNKLLTCSWDNNILNHSLVEL
ncbi:methylosome protein 50-like [Leptopilina heterotoma]|uniref:methylosome protein 50-like n=1 Tax=Leptopilina heterotoma TaxID=63436 RepID=UPI001CA850A9|nr:methylosome protein 50-like [Leptopilina heterotoma]